MYKIIVFLLCLYAGIAYGSHCDDISGTWQNQLGSNMTLLRLEGNELIGQYNTTVEREDGASLHASNITGTVTHLADGALFGFTVVFNHGKSLTTWVGQCMMCDGEEILHTTWVLRSYQKKAVDRWMSNTINQDTFKRLEVKRSNRIPRHLRGPPPKVERDAPCEKNINAGDKGFWASKSDAMQFSNCYETGKLSGKYQGQSLHGRTSGGKTAGGRSFTALGLVSSSPQEVKGWTGHIYENSKENGRKVVSSWLTHSFSNDCKDPRGSVRYGVDRYVHDVNYKEIEVNDINEYDTNPTTKSNSKSTARKVLDLVWSIFS